LATKWNMETEYIQSCNCDYGCPCNFNGYPDKGNCEAFVGYKIRNGKFGDTKLDGVKFAAAFWWPKAIHEGNGMARIYVDSAATDAQVKAIEGIAGGQNGGGVFEIFARTFTKVFPTKRAKIDWKYGEYVASFKVDGVGEVQSDYIVNPERSSSAKSCCPPDSTGGAPSSRGSRSWPSTTRISRWTTRTRRASRPSSSSRRKAPSESSRTAVRRGTRGRELGTSVNTFEPSPLKCPGTSCRAHAHRG